VREVLWATDRAAYVHHEVVPVFPKCGPRFGKKMPRLKEALQQADGDLLASELGARGTFSIDLDGEPVALTQDEVEVRLIERQGMATQGDSTLLVALDTELTEDLVAEGWAREVIHRIQSARKEADLDYADRIRVRFHASEPLAKAIDRFRDHISRETLATALLLQDAEAADLESKPVEDMDFALAIDRH
jgi:isoleucyl-tRNA synthetase